MFKITRGYVLSATLTSESKDNKNKYPVYSSQTQNNGLMGYYNDYLYDTAITWTTDGANAGTVRFRPGKFYCTNVCGVLLSDKGYANKMMGEALNNIAKKYVSYVGNPKLMNNVMAEIPLNYPNNLNEQNQISNLFQNIDNLITLHQRKYDKLVKIKSSLLEKMFPKNSSKIPEVRFKGFTEDWEQRKLDDICNRYDNLRVPVAANERISGSTPYYGANGIQDYVKGHTHDGEFVLVAEDGANDLKNYPVQYVNGLFWANNHVHVIQAKDKIASNKYLKYAISQTNIEPLLVGGGRAKLNANVMMDIAINTPGNIEEQNTLGTFINEIDNLITLHQRKLEKLKNIKKSMLEKMFV